MSGQDYRVVSEEIQEQCLKIFDEIDVEKCGYISSS
jgi:hypothetical protein